MNDLTRAREALLRADAPDLPVAITAFEQAVRRDQARVDAELMQRQSDRSPSAPAPKGGTTSRAVFAAAAKMLHPERLGWSLELPDHLRDEAEA